MIKGLKALVPACSGPLRLLVLDDQPADAELALLALERAGYQVSAEVTQNLEEFTARLRTQYYDLVLSDFNLGAFNGMDAFAVLKLLQKDTPFLLLSGSVGDEQAVDCVKQGVTDFVLKDNIVRLPVAVRRALAEHSLRAEQLLAQQALRDSEERYRTVAETAGDAILTIDSQSRIQFANRATEKIFGYSPAELQGKELTVLMPESIRKVHRAGIRRYLATGKKHLSWEATEVTGLHRSGREIPLEIAFAEFREKNQRFFTGIVRDITERKREQEALRQSEEKFAKAFDSSPTAITISTLREGRYLDVNDRFLQMTGYRRAEILGRTAAELGVWIHPEARGALLEALHRQGRVLDFEFLFRAKNGEERVGALSAEVIQVGGEPCLLASTRDDTERRRAEKALLDSQRQYESLVNSVDGIVWEADAETLQFTFVSPQAERLLGYPVKQWLEEPDFWSNHVHPEDRKWAVEHCRRAGAGQHDHNLEYRMLAAEGRTVWFRDMVNVLADGQASKLCGLMVDVTVQRELEVQFHQAQKMEAVGQLAGGVAHDFNNLLMVIRGYAELMLDRLEPQNAVRAQVEGIMQAAHRAAAVTRQLLAFSRKQVLSPKVLDLNAVVEDVGKMLLRLIGEDIELLVVKTPDLGRVKADPGQLEQVIVNLAVNARDAMPSGGKLTIETRNVELDNTYARHHISVQPGPYVLLAVTDNGIGMDAETRSRIFEPFFTTKEQGKGTGLGLATVYGIVKQSGGYIWVYSEPGQGTTFKIYLPRVQPAAAPRVTAVAVAPRAQASETVLVVEDEEGVRKVVRGFLEARGYRVLDAVSGAEAIRVAAGHQGPLHLMLTDMVMPAMSGPELAHRIRQQHPGVKVLYMSGYTQRGAGRNHNLGPEDPFLEKPFSGEALAHKVREVLDAPPSRTTAKSTVSTD